MHPDLKSVIELQQVDSRLAMLGAQIDALPSQIKTLEDNLRDYLHAHEERKLHLAANQKERRELEGEIQVIQTRISKHKDQLYQVKTNEQYKAMQKEIEGEEGNIRKIEDKILEKMLDAEEIQKLVTQAAANLEGEKARVADETKRLHSLRDADIQERDELTVRRQNLAAALNASVLDTYERVRKVRRGVAVAEVRDGFCTACNVRLRPQVYNEVRRSESVLMCESCNRILYVVEAPIEVSEQALDTTAGREASEP